MVKWGGNPAGAPFKEYGSASMSLPTITEGAEAPQNIRGRIDKPMPGATDSTLWDIQINLSALSSIYA